MARAREWYATRFLLYDHRLYCSLDLDNRAGSMDWGIDSGDVRLERDLGYDPRWHDDAGSWSIVLEQVVRWQLPAKPVVPRTVLRPSSGCVRARTLRDSRPAARSSATWSTPPDRE